MAAGASSAALKAFEGALKGREIQFASAGSRRECVLLTIHMMLEMRFLSRQALVSSVNRGRRSLLGHLRHSDVTMPISPGPSSVHEVAYHQDHQNYDQGSKQQVYQSKARPLRRAGLS